MVAVTKGCSGNSLLLGLYLEFMHLGSLCIILERNASRLFVRPGLIGRQHVRRMPRSCLLFLLFSLTRLCKLRAQPEDASRRSQCYGTIFSCYQRSSKTMSQPAPRCRGRARKTEFEEARVARERALQRIRSQRYYERKHQQAVQLFPPSAELHQTEFVHYHHALSRQSPAASSTDSSTGFHLEPQIHIPIPDEDPLPVEYFIR